jgi:hypothetical protein
MKFTVMFKDPDGVYDSLDHAAKELAATVEGIDDDEREALSETRREKIGQFVSRWITYGEYITIEFDTEAKTAIVQVAK